MFARFGAQAAWKKFIKREKPAQRSFDVTVTISAKQNITSNHIKPRSDIKTRNDVQQTAAKPSLSSMPFEITFQILTSMPDLQSVIALTDALPAAQIAYNQYKLIIITAALRNELEPQILNLLFACLDAPNVHQCKNPEASMREFVEGTLPARAELAIPLHDRSAEELQKAADLHSAVMVCATDLCATFSKEQPDHGRSRSRKQYQLSSLTKSEKTRLYRGWYHYELYCRMFSIAHLPSGTARRSYRPRGGFQAWEAEEMACIISYVKSSYRRLEHNVRVFNGRDKKTCCVRRCGPMSHWVGKTFVPCTLCTQAHDNHLCWASAGVKLLAQCLQDLEYENWTRLSKELLIGDICEPFFGFPGSWGHYMAVRDVAREMGDHQTLRPAARFLTPSDNIAEVFTLPNEGWALAHKRVVSQLYNEPEFQELRKWGYVFWDFNKFADDTKARVEIDKVAYSRHRREHWDQYVDWGSGPEAV